MKIVRCSKKGCKGHLVGYKLSKGNEGKQLIKLLITDTTGLIGYVLPNADHIPIFPLKETEKK